MDNQPSTHKEESAEALQTNEQETIFSSNEFSLEGYDKSIKNARNALFVVAAIQVIFGIISAAAIGGDEALPLIIVTSVIGIVFFLLGLWTKSKPYTAILIGLILFVSLHVIEAIAEPSSIGKGIIMKVLVIVYLVKSINDAKEAQEMKKNFDNR